MAPVLSRSLATASLASLPSSSPFTLRNPSKALSLRSAFVPQNGLRKGFSCGGLKWKLESKNRGISIRCDAAVAEKEATDTPGEKFEYQAEVRPFLCFDTFLVFWIITQLGFEFYLLSVWFWNSSTTALQLQ